MPCFSLIFADSKKSDPQDPRFTDLLTTWVSNGSIATCWTGSVGIRSHSIFDGLICRFAPSSCNMGQYLSCTNHQLPWTSRCFLFQAPRHMHIAHRLVSTSCNVAGQYTPGQTGDQCSSGAELHLLVVVFSGFKCVGKFLRTNKTKTVWVYSLLRSLKKHTSCYKLYIHRYNPGPVLGPVHGKLIPSRPNKTSISWCGAGGGETTWKQKWEDIWFHRNQSYILDVAPSQ